jgi:hemoglobin-like flavoprotein
VLRRTLKRQTLHPPINRSTNMDQETRRLVQHSWQQVVPIADAAGQLFYDNLFAEDPSLRPLFKGDMQQQAHKLTTMITAAVSKLDDLDTLVPILQDLGKRHGGYGVLPSHYDTVGAALLKTLGQGLGEAFTPQTRQAWVSVYGVMSDVMMASARKQ